MTTRYKPDPLSVNISEFNFKKGSDYLDVTINMDGYITLKLEGVFNIETDKEIDTICEQLKVALKQSKRECREIHKVKK